MVSPQYMSIYPRFSNENESQTPRLWPQSRLAALPDAVIEEG